MATKKKPERSAAQKAATKRMLAANKAKREGTTHHKAPAKKAASKPASKSGSKRPSYSKGLAASHNAPAVATRKPATTASRVKAAASKYTHAVRMRMGSVTDIVQDHVIPAVAGASAALVVDLAWGQIPTTWLAADSQYRTGMYKYAAKGALTLGLAFGIMKFAPKIIPRQHLLSAVNGGLTVLLHDAAKDYINTNHPTLGLAAYEADDLAAVLHDINGGTVDGLIQGVTTPRLAAPGMADGLAGQAVVSGMAGMQQQRPRYGTARL
jgi:hypothetical protein